MKPHNVKMWVVTTLITLSVLAGCAEKDDMGMDEMKKETMSLEMKPDSDMKKMHSKMDNMSHKNMNTDVMKMPEQMESKMDQEMNTMDTGMDESMESDNQKLE